MQKRFISLWLPLWPAERHARSDPEAATGPLALSISAQGGIRVQGVNRAAAGLGVDVGMTLADARALAPALKTAPADTGADAEGLAMLARWCGRYSPWTAPDGADGVIVESSGCDHLFGGEAALLDDLTDRLTRAGLTVRAGLADTPAAAWALARFGGDDPAQRVAPPGGGMVKLAPLPIAALRLEQETIEGLVRLGVKRIGDLYRMPRQSLGRRFGTEALRRLDKALGRIGDPISPMLPSPEFRVRLDFGEPIGKREDIAIAAERLIERLSRWLTQERRGAHRLDLAAYLADGGVSAISVNCARAMRDAKHWLRLFAEKLDHIDAGFGIDALILSAPRTESLAAVEPRLDRHRVSPDQITLLIDRLRNRLGGTSVHVLKPGASHIPELAERRALPDASLRVENWLRTPLRPSRLLPRPEPIEAIAETPDLPPRQFRWRRMSHRVVAAEGPERISPEWWKEMKGPEHEPAATRDYYRVDCAEGRSFWLYREGLYGDAAAARPPAWFMHGLF